MANLAEIIARSEQIAAGRRTDPSVNPLKDAGMTLETLYPHCLRYAIGRALRGGGTSEDYRRSHFIEIVDGVGNLPDAVLREFLCTSYLPQVTHASWIPYTDYGRSRFNNMLAYYATLGGLFYYSGDLEPVTLTETANISILNNSASLVDFELSAVLADEGRRGKLVSGPTLGIEAIIDSFVTANEINFRGKSLSAIADGTLTIRDSSKVRVLRSFAAGTINADSNAFSAAGAAFTSADVGRRLRVYQGATLIVDAYILTVVSGTACTLSAEALVTTATATAEVMGPCVELSTPSLPDVPADGTTDLGIAPKLLDDVIIVMVGALTGEISIKQLLEYM